MDRQSQSVDANVPDKALFRVGAYSDGSGPVVTVAYDTSSQYTPTFVWVYGGDDNAERWIAFDWQHADAIADAIKTAADALRTRASHQQERDRD
jgi:hypothetical protein